MEEIKKIQDRLETLDLDVYREFIALSMEMNGGIEGIPAIIGLSDLTCPERVYSGAEMDTKMLEQMAADAMICSWLCDRMPDRDPHYPAIAPAMSAMAMKTFVILEGEDSPRGYRALLEEQ